jgi:hypothetical protein
MDYIAAMGSPHRIARCALDADAGQDHFIFELAKKAPDQRNRQASQSQHQYLSKST